MTLSRPSGSPPAASGKGVVTMEQYIIPAVATIAVAVIEGLAARDRSKAKKEKQHRDEQEQAREAMMVKLVQSVNASIALGEATARAVQRIPDAHCNGDMHSALDYAIRVKHDTKDFMTQQGVHAMWE